MFCPGYIRAFYASVCFDTRRGRQYKIILSLLQVEIKSLRAPCVYIPWHACMTSQDLSHIIYHVLAPLAIGAFARAMLNLYVGFCAWMILFQAQITIIDFFC